MSKCAMSLPMKSAAECLVAFIAPITVIVSVSRRPLRQLS
jgi:hypothetical protein